MRASPTISLTNSLRGSFFQKWNPKKRTRTALIEAVTGISGTAAWSNPMSSGSVGTRITVS
jgi:hypothetical protein